MTTPAPALDALKARRAEWAPWLAVVEEVVREIGAPEWDTAVPPAGGTPSRTVPVLASLKVTLPARPVRTFLERLIQCASRGGSPKMATLRGVLDADTDALPLFGASLSQDTERIERTAAAAGADAEALQAVAALLAVPFLHACQRRLSASVSRSWIEGYCPICGSWPAFAEVRGIEQSRFFRCARCSADWHSRLLNCPYCGMSDHDQLVALVPEKGGVNGAVDACNRCRGYVKALNRLQPSASGTIMIEDLATVELDLSALDHGFTRPTGAAYAIDVRIEEQPGAARRLCGWKT